jgi:hypothetical protein
MKSGASSTEPPPARRDIEGETTDALAALVSLLPNEQSSNSVNGSHPTRDPLLERSLDFQTSLVADLVHVRNFSEKDTWYRCVGVYSNLWLEKEAAAEYAEKIRLHLLAIDQVRQSSPLSCNFTLNHFFRPKLGQLGVIHRMKAKSYVTHFFLSRMVPFFCSHTQPSDSFADVGTVS